MYRTGGIEPSQKNVVAELWKFCFGCKPHGFCQVQERRFWIWYKLKTNKL